MIVPKVFYRGFPDDGCARTGDVTFVEAIQDLNAQVPGFSQWRVEEITVCNMTSVPGYYTIGFFPSGWASITDSIDMGAVNASVPPQSTANVTDWSTGVYPHPKAIAPGALPIANTYGVFIAFSQKLPAATTLTLPIVQWGYGSEKLWAGVSPGHNSLVGIGGISLTISGCEVTP